MTKWKITEEEKAETEQNRRKIVTEKTPKSERDSVEKLTEKRVVAVCKALGDENRIRILRYLINGERCACYLLRDLDTTQSTLSYHMKILASAGIVTVRKSGTWMHYSINEEMIDAIAEGMSLFRNSLCTGGQKPHGQGGGSCW